MESDKTKDKNENKKYFLNHKVIQISGRPIVQHFQKE